MFSTGEIKLGKIFGVEITLDYSWFVILVLIILAFYGSLRQIEPGIFPWIVLLVSILSAILFFVSLLLHELSHSLVARANNIPIKKIMLFLFGGVSDILEEPASAWIEFKMAIAGPAMSIFLGIIMVLISDLFPNTFVVLFPLRLIGYTNFLLAVFNLLPGFPLDGGRIFRSLIWARTKDLLRATYYASLVGQIIAGIIMLGGLFEILSLGVASGIWLILVGFFLFQAARSSLVQTKISMVLKGHSVSEVMISDFTAINSDQTVTDLADIMQRNKTKIVVVKNSDDPIGLVDLMSLKLYPESEWHDHLVREVLKPIETYPKTHPKMTLAKTMAEMARNNVDALPVYEGEKLVGVIASEDIGYFVNIRLKTEV